MEKVLSLIKNEKLFKSGAVVGVGVSGGSDSMALLNLLYENQEDLDIEVVAIHVDHCLRESSAEDAAFVARWCKEHHIRLLKFKVDVKTIAQNKKNGIESAAREARYGIFDTCIKKNLIDVIATAHHLGDQTETILMHIFRGSGIAGAKGIELKNGYFVRPFLTTTKNEILSYNFEHKIPYVDDETNFDNKYARNFLRNKIIPLIKQQWPNVEENLSMFANTCKTDDDFINQFTPQDGIFESSSFVKIPLSYFSLQPSLINRIIIKCMQKAGIKEDFERKHITLIKDLAYGDNGAKLSLPYGVRAIKEYDYLTLIKKPQPRIVKKYKFKCGKTKVDNFGAIIIKKSQNTSLGQALHMIDANLLPKEAVWRTREDGDYLAKFGGGTKKLCAYLIDKKIPQRLRDSIPVLAVGSEILVVAGLAISSKLKVTESTKNVYLIDYDQTI